MTLFTDLFNERDAAVVTGAGNGVGRAIAQALVAEGVPTIFTDLNEDTVKQAIADSAKPEIAFPWVGDLASSEGHSDLAAFSQKKLGLITRFVHSASPPRKEKDNILTVSEQDWERMRRVNVDAGFSLLREFSRALIQAKRPGSMLVVTSLHAHTPRNLPHYSTSKASLSMLVKEFSKTLGQFGIRVNALVPGAIAAGGFVADPAMTKFIPMGRLGQSGDLAPMAVTLLSDKTSAYVTGSEFVVDGGMSLSNWFDWPQFSEPSDEKAST